MESGLIYVGDDEFEHQNQRLNTQFKLEHAPSQITQCIQIHSAHWM